MIIGKSHGASHLSVSSDLEVLHRNWSFFVVRMQISSRLKMLQPHQVAVSYNRYILLAERFTVVRFYEPFVVIVFMSVCGDLLLTRTSSLGVEMKV